MIASGHHRILIAVQHHPSREALLPDLLSKLGDAIVAQDPEPNGRPSAWRSYQVALACAMTQKCTHLAVIQDDTDPQPGFREKLDQAVKDHPDKLIALFVAGLPKVFRSTMLLASRARQPYADLHRCPWVPTVATVWPAALIPSFLEWAHEKYRADWRGDDNIVGDWARAHRVPAVATVPSIVEHPDCVPGVLGREPGFGRNKARVAALL